MSEEENNRLNGKKDSGNAGHDGRNGRDVRNSSRKGLDPAVRDALIKRVEAEALQCQQDHDKTNITNTQQQQQAVKKLPASKTPGTSPTAFANGRNAKTQLTDTTGTGETNQGVDEEEIIKIVANQASLATAQMLKENDDIIIKQEHKHTGMEAQELSNSTQPLHRLSFFPKQQAAAASIIPPVKGLTTSLIMSEEAEENSTTTNDLMQMAIEINENAKMEKIAKAANSQNATNSIISIEQQDVQPEENSPQRQQQQQQQQQQPSRPGAYLGLPGEALQRAADLRFSLVGAGATGQQVEPVLLQRDDRDHHDSTTPLPTIIDGLPTSTSEQQLAVADLVWEDEDEETNDRQSAAPVDLQQVQQREETQKRQHHLFIAVAVCLLVVAASTVAAVVRTKGQKQPEVDLVPSSESPTAYGSMTPSKVPSSAPTGVLDLLFDSLPDYTLAGINNGSETPQWRAWQWLANHQNITNLTEWRKKQLFALATFFHAFNGNKWNPLIKERWMDDTVDECNWFSSGFGFFATWDGKYYELASPESPCNDHGQFTSLDLNDLQLSGLEPVLPPEITLMTSLSRLHLIYNDIGGPLSSFFPPEFSTMTALKSLGLSGNLLGGPVPSELILLTSLGVLDLSINQLSGPLPSELGLLTTLEWLRIDQNQLTHLIPSELGAMPALSSLKLNGNQFTGPFPMELWLLTLLLELHLYDNQVTGTIPTEIGMMTSLKSLELHNNTLSGTLPSQLNASMGLRLDGNQFSGTVPGHLCFLLRCDCSLNETPPVATCSDLTEAPPDWPGRFPTSTADVMLNIQTDIEPQETSWTWQQQTIGTGVWDTLESGVPLEFRNYLYSFPFPVNTDTAYRLIVSDSLGDGIGTGWITLTATSQTVLYSLVAGGSFSEFTVDVLVGADGSFDVSNSTA